MNIGENQVNKNRTETAIEKIDSDINYALSLMRKTEQMEPEVMQNVLWAMFDAVWNMRDMVKAGIPSTAETKSAA